MSVVGSLCPARAEKCLLQLFSHPAPDRDGHWQQIVNHPQYRFELRRTSFYFVQRYRLPRDWQGDIEQDAVLLLHRAMRRRLDLGFDPEKAGEQVLPWLRAVIRSHCLQAIRRIRAQQRRYQNQRLDEKFAELAARPSPSWQDAFWLAIEGLPPESRRMIETYLRGGSIRAAAVELGLTWSSARRALNKNLRLLKHVFYARLEDLLDG